jgi:hypothetical protein
VASGNGSVPFLHLWKVDDKDWVKQRRAEWKALEETAFADNSKMHNRALKRYFLEGQKEGYLGTIILFLLTPIDSADSAREVFESNLFKSKRARSEVLGDYVLRSYKFGHSMPWFRQQVQWFVEGVLGKRYEEVHEYFGDNREVISPNPSFWCLAYVVNALEVLKGARGYDPCVDCIDYFVSAAAHATDPFYREKCQIEPMLQAAAAAAAGREDLGEIAHDFARVQCARAAEIRANWLRSDPGNTDG